MEKELCFIIDGNKIYLEKVLIDYMEIPIFYLCKSKFGYYIVLCSDFDEFNYIVSRISKKCLYGLLHGIISMRDAMLADGEYWEIFSSDDINSDTVVRHSISDIDPSILPEEGATYKILTKDMVQYVKEFDYSIIKEAYTEILSESSISITQSTSSKALPVTVKFSPYIGLRQYSFSAKISYEPFKQSFLNYSAFTFEQNWSHTKINISFKNKSNNNEYQIIQAIVA